MQKPSKRAQEIRILAKELSDIAGGSITFLQLQEAAAAKWYEGDLSKVRSDYLLNTLVGGHSQLVFVMEGDKITVTTVMPKSRTPRVSPDDFVYRMIETLPWCVYRGAIHTVFSRFNATFRVYFSNLDPVEHTKQMAAEKKIYVKPFTGGVLISREPFTAKRAIPPEEILAALDLSF